MKDSLICSLIMFIVGITIVYIPELIYVVLFLLAVVVFIICSYIGKKVFAKLNELLLSYKNYRRKARPWTFDRFVVEIKEVLGGIIVFLAFSWIVELFVDALTSL